MDHKKYSSIENAYRKKYIESIQQQGLSGGNWVVVEKVHGSNASFLYDGEEFKFAKRTSLADGGFYNCQPVIDKYEPVIKQIFNGIKDAYPDVISIQIYFELYGGSYPEYKSTTKAIQKGVFYNPDIDAYFFDIRLNYEDKSIFMNFDDAVSIFKEYDVLYAEELFRGSFREALEYTNEYNSTIPDRLGLPAIETNICEGNIIKPVEEKRFGNGERVILKNKNEKWSEKSNKSRSPKVPKEIPEHLKPYLESIGEYITENRLKNVLSKIDPSTINQKSFGMLSGTLVKDALEDYIKDNEGFKELPKEEQKQVTKNAGRLSAELIRPVFLDILDQVY
jgi:Rnl2 family RNA ligase